MLTVKELRRAIRDLPEDAIVFLCTEKTKFGVTFDEIRFSLKENNLYLGAHAFQECSSALDMLNIRNQRMLDKHGFKDARDMVRDAKRLVESKQDGKKHRIQIILSEWAEYLCGQLLHRNRWLSAVVDDMREFGGKLGVGSQTKLCDFEMESPQK